MRPFRLLFAIAAVGTAAAILPTAGAAPPSAQQMTGEQAAGIVFTEVEKRLISDYFVQHPGFAVEEEGGKGKSNQMPPGLAKRKRLPPGLQKHLEKFGTLPPGLAKRDLPPDLLSTLPPPHAGTIRQIVGSDVVLLQEGTNIVLDVLENVLKK